MKRKTVSFRSRDGWGIKVTVGPRKDGFGIVSIGGAHFEMRPLDFAPFHILDALCSSHPDIFPTLDDAMAHARAL